MNWEQALRQRLLDETAVAALVGSRVDWTRRAQDGALPAVVLTLVSDPRPQHLEGFEARRQSRVQIDCLASGANGKTRAEVAALREAVIAVLAPAATVGAITFGRSTFDPVRDLGEDTESGFVHRDSFDAYIWHD